MPYGWESGQALPDADCLIKLCVLYNITDVPWAFGFTKNTDVIIPTKHESEVIRKYRSETDMQQAVDKLLGVNQNYSKNILTS